MKLPMGRGNLYTLIFMVFSFMPSPHKHMPKTHYYQGRSNQKTPTRHHELHNHSHADKKEYQPHESLFFEHT